MTQERKYLQHITDETKTCFMLRHDSSGSHFFEREAGKKSSWCYISINQHKTKTFSWILSKKLTVHLLGEQHLLPTYLMINMNCPIEVLIFTALKSLFCIWTRQTSVIIDARPSCDYIHDPNPRMHDPEYWTCLM